MLQPMDETKDHIMMDGNTATGLGCVFAGATVGAWYPITPSTSLMDAYKSFCKQFRMDTETGGKKFCIVQAEDELAAIGIVLGATWNGARAFTPTSGPGISLMGEFIGFAYYAELPAVIFDVQRTGPSTGMPTRTQQCDLLLCAYSSHGDTKHVLLFPANPEECFYMAVAAFDLADQLQVHVSTISRRIKNICNELLQHFTTIADEKYDLDKDQFKELLNQFDQSWHTSVAKILG